MTEVEEEEEALGDGEMIPLTKQTFLWKRIRRYSTVTPPLFLSQMLIGLVRFELSFLSEI